MNVGSALTNSSSDRGGIELSRSRINTDGTTSALTDWNGSPDVDHQQARRRRR